MTSVVQVRPAGAADLVSAKALLDAHRHELGFVTLPALRQALDRGWLYIADADDTVVGVIDWWARRDGVVVLYNIVVDPAFRGCGVGRQLLRTMIGWAKERDAAAIRLKCPEELPSNAFYERHGFVLTAREPGKRRSLNCWSLSLVQPMDGYRSVGWSRP